MDFAEVRAMHKTQQDKQTYTRERKDGQTSRLVLTCEGIA